MMANPNRNIDRVHELADVVRVDSVNSKSHNANTIRVTIGAEDRNSLDLRDALQHHPCQHVLVCLDAIHTQRRQVTKRLRPSGDLGNGL